MHNILISQDICIAVTTNTLDASVWLRLGSFGCPLSALTLDMQQKDLMTSKYALPEH